MLTRKSFKVVSFLAAFSLLSAGAFAEDIFVSANWNDQAAVDADANVSGLTFGTDAFNGVQSAIDAAVNGDTITIFPGNYGEHIVINKENLTLIGPNDGLDPSTRTRGPEAVLTRLTITTPGRTAPAIRGLKFDVGGANNHGIDVMHANGANVSYNIVENIGGSSSRAAIHCRRNQNGLFSYNLIQTAVGGGHAGIDGRGNGENSNTDYIGNSILNVAYTGFLFDNINNVRILGNRIQNVGRHGINIGSRCNDYVIAGNYLANVNFRNNRDDRHTGAIRIYSGNPTSPESPQGEGNVSNILIEYNTIDNANYAVFFRNAYFSGDHTDTMLPPGVIIRYNNFLNSVYAAIGMPGINLDDNEALIEDNFLQGNPTLVDDYDIIPTVSGFQSVPTDTDLIDVVSSAGSFLPLDSDGDGIPDWKEVHIYGTDPNNPDEDGDGVPDGLQIALGGDPTTGTPGTINGEPLIPANLPGDCDSDGDGYSDAYKVLLGLDPNDPTVSPSLGDVNNNGFIDNGDAAIVFNVAAGLISSSNFNINRMDVNQDGVVNNIDANILFNRFLGVPGFEILPYKPGTVCD